MENKRMNHVFNEMVVKAGRDIDTAELQFINGGVSATFFCAQQAIHAAYAINNHDRMVEEIAELKGKLESIWSIVETEKTCNAGNWDEEFGAGEVFDEIQELAKLNQEGEE